MQAIHFYVSYWIHPTSLDDEHTDDPENELNQYKILVAQHLFSANLLVYIEQPIKIALLC